MSTGGRPQQLGSCKRSGLVNWCASQKSSMLKKVGTLCVDWCMYVDRGRERETYIVSYVIHTSMHAHRARPSHTTYMVTVCFLDGAGLAQ